MSDEFVCERPTREPWLSAWENLADKRDGMDPEMVREIVALDAKRREQQGRFGPGRWP